MRKIWKNFITGFKAISEAYSLISVIIIAIIIALLMFPLARNQPDHPQIVINQHSLIESGQVTDEVLNDVLKRLSEITGELESIRQSHDDLLSALTETYSIEESPSWSPEIFVNGYKEFLGYFELTFYCTCQRCCGVYSAEYQHAIGNYSFVQRTASGHIPIKGRTLAAPPRFSFGTELYVSGWGWLEVQDRGSAVQEYTLDVYVGCHQTAINLGRQRGIRVYTHL